MKVTSAVHVTGQALRFEGCSVGVDTTSGGNGLLNLIDSTAENTTTLVNAATTTSSQGSLVLENVIVGSSVPEVGCSLLNVASFYSVRKKQDGC